MQYDSTWKHGPEHLEDISATYRNVYNLRDVEDCDLLISDLLIEERKLVCGHSLSLCLYRGSLADLDVDGYHQFIATIPCKVS